MARRKASRTRRSKANGGLREDSGSNNRAPEFLEHTHTRANQGEAGAGGGVKHEPIENHSAALGEHVVHGVCGGLELKRRSERCAIKKFKTRTCVD